MPEVKLENELRGPEDLKAILEKQGFTLLMIYSIECDYFYAISICWLFRVICFQFVLEEYDKQVRRTFATTFESLVLRLLLQNTRMLLLAWIY